MSDFQDKLLAKLAELATQFEQIEQALVSPDIGNDIDRMRELGVKRAALASLVKRYQDYTDLQKQRVELEEIILANEDAELVELAQEELPSLKSQAEELMDAMSKELVTADDRSVGSVILEIRSASGGDEAALFAGDLYEMYQRYALAKRWTFEQLNFAKGDQGGIRHVVISVKGESVWQFLGYEGGVHCVKRVPATETQGRVHTSTATVAVLPEPEKVQIEIPDSEVEIHVTTAQGPGGQNVNKVATAVHMIHTPTGIEVRMQESKSQAQNKQKAWMLLRARVYDLYQREKDAERAESRSSMIGSGGRAERIRTYRFKDNRVVDHRLNQSFTLQATLAGDLDSIVDGLISMDRAQRLASL